MNQTRMVSLIEAIVNTVIGFFISFILWPIASFLFDIPYDVSSHFGVVGLFTVASVARGYVIRRFFNSRLKKFSMYISNYLSRKLSGDNV